MNCSRLFEGMGQISTPPVPVVGSVSAPVSGDVVVVVLAPFVSVALVSPGAGGHPVRRPTDVAKDTMYLIVEGHGRLKRTSM